MGFPAFAADGVYHLYTEVDRPAPGAFDPALHRSVPQSEFWTTGPSTNGLAFYERLTALDPDGGRFPFLPVFTGPDDENGVPFQILYGVSGNTHNFWSIANARKVIGYKPQDNSQIKFAEKIQEIVSQASRSS